MVEDQKGKRCTEKGKKNSSLAGITRTKLDSDLKRQLQYVCHFKKQRSIIVFSNIVIRAAQCFLCYQLSSLILICTTPVLLFFIVLIKWRQTFAVLREEILDVFYITADIEAQQTGKSSKSSSAVRHTVSIPRQV